MNVGGIGGSKLRDGGSEGDDLGGRALALYVITMIDEGNTIEDFGGSAVFGNDEIGGDVCHLRDTVFVDVVPRDALSLELEGIARPTAIAAIGFAASELAPHPCCIATGRGGLEEDGYFAVGLERGRVGFGVGLLGQFLLGVGAFHIDLIALGGDAEHGGGIM